MDEKELIQQSQGGNSEAFTLLLQLHVVPFKSKIISHYNVSPEDAEDIIQTASSKAWTKISHFRQDSSFNTWLFTIIRNEALNLIKKRNRIQHFEVPATNTLISDETNDYEFINTSDDIETDETAEKILLKKEKVQELRLLIDGVMNKLKKEHSTIIKLAFEDELSYKEIGKKLNIPIGTVMSRLFIAKNKAKQLILQTYGNES